MNTPNYKKPFSLTRQVQTSTIIVKHQQDWLPTDCVGYTKIIQLNSPLMDHLNNWSCTDIYDENGRWQDYLSGYDPKLSDSSVLDLEGTSDLMWNLGGILPDLSCNVNPFASSLPHCGELSPGLSTARFSQARPLDYSHGLDESINTPTTGSTDDSPWSPSQEYAMSKKERRRAQNRKAQQGNFHHSLSFTH